MLSGFPMSVRRFRVAEQRRGRPRGPKSARNDKIKGVDGAAKAAPLQNMHERDFSAACEACLEGNLFLFRWTQVRLPPTEVGGPHHGWTAPIVKLL